MQPKLLPALLLIPVLTLPALAQGFWITGSQGDVTLGNRRIRQGDILTEAQMAALSSQNGAVTYRQVQDGQPSEELTAAFSLGTKLNKAPIAEDSTEETYKNLEITARLRVRDPEGQAMTFTVTRQPRRGFVKINEDGTFLYTPKKNKVGVDSFAYTACDASGAVSREATVILTIIQPTDDERYTDTFGSPCCFAAQWMKNTGIFEGERVDGNATFCPGKSVTRGELLAMVVRTLELPTDNDEDAAWNSELPGWLKPYVAAAMRSGLIENVSQAFCADAPATVIEATDLVCNALGLEGISALMRDAAPAGHFLCRGDAARLLYAAHKQLRGGKVRILG